MPSGYFEGIASLPCQTIGKAFKLEGKPIIKYNSCMQLLFYWVGSF